MRNKYPGTCYICGKTVEKGQGHFQRDLGKWLVKHAGCVKGDVKTAKYLMHIRRALK